MSNRESCDSERCQTSKCRLGEAVSGENRLRCELDPGPASCRDAGHLDLHIGQTAVSREMPNRLVPDFEAGSTTGSSPVSRSLHTRSLRKD
jgi:hypothetical protein